MTIILLILIAICAFGIWVIIDYTKKYTEAQLSIEQSKTKVVVAETDLKIAEDTIKFHNNTIEKQNTLIENLRNQLKISTDVRKIQADQNKQLQEDLETSHQLWNNLNTKHAQLEQNYRAMAEKYKIPAEKQWDNLKAL